MRTLRAGLWGVLLLTAGCGAESLGPAAVILLTNTWNLEGNDLHRFSIVDDANGEPRSEGTFTGTEILPDDSEHELTGSWSNSRVTLTLARVPGVTYRATLTEDNPDRLVFNSPQGSFVMVRP